MIGIASMPKMPNKTGVIIAVGGPQYRAGSHRQFVLLSRALAEAGYTCMRFDYRGMGDSTGEMRNFEEVNDDFSSAIDAFMSTCPTVENVVLWGLCDAASAILLYLDATLDARVCGVVLLNPWVRSEASLAKTHIKHYYAQRILQTQFWIKLLKGKLGIRNAFHGLVENIKKIRAACSDSSAKEVLSFQEKMSRSLFNFSGSILILLSENDYTAKEFIERSKNYPKLIECLAKSNINQIVISEADHTFSSEKWRIEVEVMTRQWLENGFDLNIAGLNKLL